MRDSEGDIISLLSLKQNRPRPTLAVQPPGCLSHQEQRLAARFQSDWGEFEPVGQHRDGRRVERSQLEHSVLRSHQGDSLLTMIEVISQHPDCVVDYPQGSCAQREIRWLISVSPLVAPFRA